MNQIYVDEGLVSLLHKLVFDDLDFHLFNNNVTIDRDTVLADLTEESTFGYAEITVASADWTTEGVAGHVGSILGAPLAWIPAGGDWTLYGYYVTNVGGTELLFAANFDGAPITVLNGEPVLVTPKLGDFSKLAS